MAIGSDRGGVRALPAAAHRTPDDLLCGDLSAADDVDYALTYEPASPDVEEDALDIPARWAQKYTYVRALGMGAYGRVMLVKVRQPSTAGETPAGSRVPREYSHPWEFRAIKVTANDMVDDSCRRVTAISQATIQELTLMQSIHGRVGDDENAAQDRAQHAARNPNAQHVISCEDYMSTPQRFLLVMPYANCGTLENWLQTPATETASFAATQCLGSQLLKALECLHQNSYLHLDIKPENLLLFRDHAYASGFLLRLADFGLSKHMPPFSRLFADTDVVTPFFRPPEVFFAGMITRFCDIWSAGVIFYQMLTRERPWKLDPKVEFTYLYLFELICAQIGVPTADDLRAMHVRPDAVFLDQMGLAPPRQGRNLLVERLGQVLEQRAWERPLREMAAELLQRTIAMNPRRRLSAASLLRLPFFARDATAAAEPPVAALKQHVEPALPPALPVPSIAAVRAAAPPPRAANRPSYLIASSSPVCSEPRSTCATPVSTLRHCTLVSDNMSLVKNTCHLNLLSSPGAHGLLSSPGNVLGGPQTLGTIHDSSPLGFRATEATPQRPSQGRASAPNSPRHAPTGKGGASECLITSLVRTPAAATTSPVSYSNLPYARLAWSSVAQTTPSATPVGRGGLNPMARTLAAHGSAARPTLTKFAACPEMALSSPAPSHPLDAASSMSGSGSSADSVARSGLERPKRKPAHDLVSLANDENAAPKTSAAKPNTLENAPADADAQPRHVSKRPRLFPAAGTQRSASSVHERQSATLTR